MATLISHFYNEAYLLPFWLNHHKHMFDHGILIDHHSTDDSVTICKNIVPDWTIVTSKLSMFDAVMTDAEVMQMEWDVQDWKLALNTTEFLITGPNGIQGVQHYITDQKAIGGWIESKIMVDIHPDQDIDRDIPFAEQKLSGLFQNELTAFEKWTRKDIQSLFSCPRNRLFHNALCGAYAPGRHNSHLSPLCTIPRDVAFIQWRAFSPWNQAFIDRKCGIKKKIPQHTIDSGMGVHHLKSELEWKNQYKILSDLIKKKSG